MKFDTENYNSSREPTQTKSRETATYLAYIPVIFRSSDTLSKEITDTA